MNLYDPYRAPDSVTTAHAELPPRPPPPEAIRRGASVLGTFIDASPWDEAVARIEQWAAAHESRTVYFCNVHSVVSARRDIPFARALAGADLAAPDGAPIAWMLRRLGFAGQPRVSGPDLMAHLCDRLRHASTPVFLYGSTPRTLERLQQQLRARYPGLTVVGAISPPFGAIDADTDAEHVARINASGARIVFVGMGCPRQEVWCEAHRGRVHAVMVAVGAAFDFHAGTMTRAPHWMRRNGLEWLHRLACEPRRLWKRYLVGNTVFVVGATGQLMRSARPARSRRHESDRTSE